MKILLAFGVGVVLLTGLAAAGDTKDEMKKLQGTWKGEFEGKKFEMKLEKDKFTVTFSDGNNNIVFMGKIKIDPSKKPKEIDLTIEEGKDFTGKTSQGIYEVDGDSLKWCANEPGKDTRPTAFPAKEGETAEGGMYLVLKKSK
jgi:uncharacterized protein (TIGR03067 family)